MGTRGKKPAPVADRFWPKVNVRGPDDCWEWAAYRDPNGYGRFSIGPMSKVALAHRVAYQLDKGEVGDNTVICHRCDNPPCVNPAHLFAGSQTDNMQDCAEKGRTTRLTGALCSKGLHEMTEANALPRSGHKGRECRACRYKYSRERARRLRDEAGKKARPGRRAKTDAGEP